MCDAIEPYIEINELLDKYDFPLEVLADVHNRLRDNDDPQYAMQQVRYLRNVVSAGRARKRNDERKDKQ